MRTPEGLQTARQAAIDLVYGINTRPVTSGNLFTHNPYRESPTNVNTHATLLRNDSPYWVIGVPGPTFQTDRPGLHTTVGALDPEQVRKASTEGPAKPVFFDMLLIGGAVLTDPAVPTYVFGDTEVERLLVKDHHDQWEQALALPRARIFARRTAMRLTSHPGDTITPLDNPGDPTFINAVGTFAADHGLSNLTYLEQPVTQQQDKPLFAGANFSVYKGEPIRTPWSDKPVYTHSVYFTDPEGQITDYSVVITKRPMMQMLIDPAQTSRFGIESLCTCMICGRNGCECKDNFPTRMRNVFQNDGSDGIFVLNLLQTTMGVGELVGHTEHFERAQLENVLKDGTVPTLPNLLVRLERYGIPEAERHTLDLREYDSLIPFFTMLRANRPGTAVIDSDNRRKIGALKGAGFTVGVDHSGELPSNAGDVYTRLRNSANYQRGD